MRWASKPIIIAAIMLSACEGEAVPVNQVDRRGSVSEMADGEWQTYCAQEDLSDLDRADCASRKRIEGLRAREKAAEQALGQ